MTEKINREEAQADYSGRGAAEEETALTTRENQKIRKSMGNFKGIILFGFIVLLGFNSMAQDVITLKNGNDIQALVQEVGDVDVKYKKFDNPNGPNYTLKKAEIFMIRYANGSKDVFTDNAEITKPIQKTVQNQEKTHLEPLSIDGITIYNSDNVKLSKYEIRNTMSKIPLALDQYNRGRNQRRAGIGFFIPQCILLGVGLGFIIVDPFLGGMIMVGSISAGIPAIIFLTVGNHNIKNSVMTYNRGIKQKYTSNVSLNFGIMQSGNIGLVLNF